MTSWIVKIGETTPQHWDFARDDRLWDVRKPGFFRRIELGDDVYFWLAKTALVSWVRATTSLYPIGTHARVARWTDNHLGQYSHRFEFEVVSEDVPRLAAWDEIRAAGGKNYAAQSPANEITEPTAEAFLRAQFGTHRDIGLDPPHVLVEPGVYTPGEDMRDRAEREITLRRGQSKFRSALLAAYESTCAVTGSAVPAVLEAAHIERYFGDHSNRVDNGILLRSDIHTLFDLRQLTVTDDLSVALAPWLMGSEYGPLHSTELRLPQDAHARPNADALRRHRESCEWM